MNEKKKKSNLSETLFFQLISTSVSIIPIDNLIVKMKGKNNVIQLELLFKTVKDHIIQQCTLFSFSQIPRVNRLS